MSKETQKTVSINYGKCPVCSNPLEQIHTDYINGICAERTLKCNFCLSYEYEFSYGDIREIIAWKKWIWRDHQNISLDRYFKEGTKRKNEQREFVNMFKHTFENYRLMPREVFADWLQETIFKGETNELIEQFRYGLIESK